MTLDDALLLADWLNSMIYEMATRKMLFGRFAVQFNATGLSAVRASRHRAQLHIDLSMHRW